MALKQFLEQRYPQLQGRVRGQHHPSTPSGALALRAAQLLQAASTAFVFAGEQLLAMVGINRHPVALQALENRFPIMTMSFLLSNYAQNLATTGAFEIIINGRLVFSKLKSGRLPNVDEILVIVEEAFDQDRARASSSSNANAKPGRAFM